MFHGKERTLEGKLLWSPFSFPGHDVRVQTMDFEVAFELYLRTVEEKKSGNLNVIYATNQVRG